MLNHVDPKAGECRVGDWANQENKGERQSEVEEELSDLSDSLLSRPLGSVPERFAQECGSEKKVPGNIEVHLAQFTHENVICESFSHDPQ